MLEQSSYLSLPSRITEIFGRWKIISSRVGTPYLLVTSPIIMRFLQIILTDIQTPYRVGRFGNAHS